MSVWHYQGIDYGDLFGCYIAISEDYIIVGAHNGDYNPDGFGGVSQAGAAYIFRRIDDVWEADQKVCATIRGGWDRYGYSVAIDSNVAVVGAKAEDHSEFEAAFLHNAGSAYIYTRDLDGLWTPQKIDASDRDVGDHFGIEVDVQGDYMVIGAEAHNYDEDTEDELPNAGAAYIFEKDGDDVWSEVQKLDASDRDTLDLFADAVAISEHTILIGAWQQDLDSASLSPIEDAGAAYFFSSLLCTEDFVEQDISLCAGEALIVGESTYLESGTYVDTLLNSDACDSIITSHLFVAPIMESEATIELCFGESYLIGESVYEESGTYEDTLASLMGCDSIVTTILLIEEENRLEQVFTVCYGDTIMVGESVYSETGIYTTVFESESSCDSTVVTNLNVLEAIDLAITADLFTLTAEESVAASTNFQWIKCDPFELIPGATDQTYIAEEDGYYAVIIEKEGCKDTTECQSILGVGINESNSAAFKLYPNPSNGQFKISFTTLTSTNAELIITNNLGTVVYQSTLETTTSEIDLSHLSKGNYILQLTLNDTILKKKLILQ